MADVTFSLTQCSTTPQMYHSHLQPSAQYIINDVLHSLRGIGIPFVYAPYVYWNMGAYQNVTPGLNSSNS